MLSTHCPVRSSFGISGVLLLSSVIVFTTAMTSRLPQTSANQMVTIVSSANRTQNHQSRSNKTFPHPSPGSPPPKSSTAHIKEQYIFSVFEAIISTLESKLQRIENLDKAMEQLMRRIENLDSRVSNSINKMNLITIKLEEIDEKLISRNSHAEIHKKLFILEQKMNDLDNKVTVNKCHLDTNYVQGADDINIAGSEKKPITVSFASSADVITHVDRELGLVRAATDNVDKKLEFHTNLVSDNLYKIQSLLTDVHDAIVEDYNKMPFQSNLTATTESSIDVKVNKIDSLVEQMRPIISVSEKMDEVWDVVVGTKSSVDDLLPKSDELLTQTQRQERAIGEIHSDLRKKTNKIIANLDKVEKRLKKQEDDVAILTQRPSGSDMGTDGKNETFVVYDLDSKSEEITNNVPDTTSSPVYTTVVTANISTSFSSSSSSTSQTENKRNEKRKGTASIIFPSVRNKPFISNTSFTTDSPSGTKEVKGFSCIDLLNSGLKESGVYYLQIRGTTFWFLKVYCEQELADGGWTVIQRRDDFGEPRESFNRDWNDYKNGFGDPAKEFWLGNENIYMLTNNEDYSLRIELEDFDGNKRYAQYSHFKIFSEGEYYKLEIEGYEGNAGDSLNDPWYGSNSSPFSTYNRDNDRSSLNCASMLKGGWWWKSCGRGLNGLYLSDPQDLTARQGIVWFRWRGWDYTLRKSVMMIKPKGYVTGT